LSFRESCRYRLPSYGTIHYSFLTLSEEGRSRSEGRSETRERTGAVAAQDYVDLTERSKQSVRDQVGLQQYGGKVLKAGQAKPSRADADQVLGLFDDLLAHESSGA
jgi:hypothetical protein